jgi:uncharacterized protein YhhL (DUF1145 family)
MLKTVRIVTMAVWLAVLINLFYPLLGDSSHWLSWLGLAILVTHGIECLIFRRDIARDYSGRQLAGYLVVLIYGFGRTGEWVGKK